MTKIPKWYKFKERQQIREKIIEEELTIFTKNKTLKPNKKQIEEYNKELSKLSFNQLTQLNQINKLKPKYKLPDKLSKLNKKKAIVIRIYNKNETITDYISSKHKRLVKINDCVYVIPPDKGLYDTKHKLITYSYYENNPLPLTFTHKQPPTTIPDGGLIKQTMRFEFAEVLSKSDISKRIDITMIFSILGFIAALSSSAIGLFIAKHLGMI